MQDAIAAGRRWADQGRPVMDIANELDTWPPVLSKFSVELAAQAERAAVEVMQAHQQRADA